MTHITVPDDDPFLETAVTGSTSAFPFTFTYFDATDLRVTVNSVELAQADFEVVGTPGYEGGYPGGTVTLDVAVSNSTVRIWSEMPPARVNDFLEGPGFPARSINTELDRLTARQRDVRLRFQRTPVLAFANNHTLTADEAGQIFTNEGKSATYTYSLPAASAGLVFTFAVVVAFSLVIDAAGSDTVGGAGSLSNTAIGSMITLRGFDSGLWLVESSSGTWA
jgi:hypothetical protein